MKEMNPYVRIDVRNSSEDIFASSDPIEIFKHNLNGLGIGAPIDINNIEYIIKDIQVTLLRSPMGYEYGVDFFEKPFGNEIPYIALIKITVED